MSKQFKFSINGNDFILPIKALNQNPANTYIGMNAKYTASVIKQYVKNSHPTLKVSSKSDVYSGGSSVRVHVCNADGSSVSNEIFKTIEQWKWILSGGSYNGMEDIYEYREDDMKTDSGTAMKYFPSYIFIENKPSWGTIEYWMDEYRTYKTGDTSEHYQTTMDKVGGWLKYNEQYMSKTVLGKFNDYLLTL
jgi:hypothetical protein